MKPQSFTVTIGVYNTDVLFALNETDKKVRKLLSDRGVRKKDISLVVNLPSSARGRTLSTETGIFVRLKKFSGPELHMYVSHEIFHVVKMIMDRVGMTLSDDSEEAYAYLTGWITKEFYEKIDLS